MKLLIDTHVVIWATTASSKLSKTAADAILSPDNVVFASAACAYEIEYKRPFDAELAKLPDLNAIAAQVQFSWLPLTHTHAAFAGRLPRVHRDPWDRLITAQALVEGMIVISVDEQLSALGATRLW